MREEAENFLKQAVSMGKKDTLSSFINKVNKKFPLEFAVLFGSRARGESLKSSDYDILFVSNCFHKDIFKRMTAILDLWDVKGSLESICFTTEEFEKGMKGYNAIVWGSLRDGIVLLGAKKFKKYQDIFRNAVESGDIEIRKEIKFNKPPELIVGTGI